jgi:PAS domain-containing protein
MLTGRAEPEDLDEVIASGANDYITKPFKLDVLETRIAFAERQVQVNASTVADLGRAYRSILEVLPLITYTRQHGDSGRITFLSPQYQTITGWAPAPILVGNADWMPLVHLDDAELYTGAWRAAVRDASEFRVEYRFQSRAGSYLWFAEPRCRCAMATGRLRFGTV